jgi:glycosyltransferase involved in cell wall biosynthesis
MCTGAESLGSCRDVLIVSIVDPARHRGGAGTVTRGLLDLLRGDPLQAAVRLIAPPPRTRLQHVCRQGASVMSAWWSHEPAKMHFLRSRAMAARLRQALRDRPPDLVLVNGADLLWTVPRLPRGVPRLLVAHNIEYALYLQQIAALGRPWRIGRRWLHTDAARLRTVELAGIEQMDGVLCVSVRDAESLGRELPHVRTFVMPPCFPGEPPEAAGRRPRTALTPVRLGMVANFDWWPNRHGLHWFLSEVFAHVRAPVELHLFGSGSRRLGRGRARVTPHGFVADATAVWDACDVVICPVTTGAGVSVKLVEALFHRRPVIATPFAAGGLPAIRDAALCVLETAADWIRLLESPALADLAARSVSPEVARTFAVDRYRAPFAHWWSGCVQPSNEASINRPSSPSSCRRPMSVE